MSDILKRVEALEKKQGSQFADMVVEIIQDEYLTDTGLCALGETWDREAGETDAALRRRATADMLKLSGRELMRKVMLETMTEMLRRTCPLSSFKVIGDKIFRLVDGEIVQDMTAEGWKNEHAKQG